MNKVASETKITMRDIDIRKRLTVLLRDTFQPEDPTSRIVDEFSLCQGTSRIDMAVINGFFHGYEIKSERDTLNRVDSQFETYSKTFDYLTFVVSEKHLAPIKHKIPRWCGIMIAEQNGDEVTIRELRKPKHNSVDPHSIVQLLWKDEALALLQDLGYTKGFASKNKKEIWAKLESSVTTDELSSYVRTTIKQRQFWRVDQQLSLCDG